MENEDRQEKEEISWDVTRQGIKRGKKKTTCKPHSRNL